VTAHDGERDRRAEALAHLQTSAIEFIEAARAVLDVVEEAVREPGGLTTMMSDTLAAFLSVVPIKSNAASSDGQAEPSGVEHIRIS
jgi:hypothetical protein